MKKIFYIFSIVVCCVGCQTYRASDSVVTHYPVAHQMPLEVRPIADKWWWMNGKQTKVFMDYLKGDVQTNFVQSYSNSKIGSIEISWNKYENIGTGYMLLACGFEFFVPLGILGIPVGNQDITLEVTFNIKDTAGRLINHYTYLYSEKCILGVYYGKATKRLLVDGAKNIMSRFRIDFEKEYEKNLALLNKYTTPKENQGNINYAYSIQDKSNTKTVSQEKSRIDTQIPHTNIVNENTYVLIIANENYESLSPVAYAANDGQIFKQYCIQTLGIPEKQIRYCANASFGNMAGAIDWLSYALNNFEGAKGIVYYCGHGIPDEKTNQAYLIPVDGKGTNTSTCLSLNKLYKTLAATKAQSITYFMDACFTGANKEGSMLVAARGVARAPEKETLTGKTIVFSASSGDETAMTLENEGHGLFTYYLLKKLQESEGNVTYGELAEYINKNVKKDAFLINEKPQTPVVATSPAVVNTWKTMKLK